MMCVMDLKYLKTFLYTAELSSFTRAAELLGYSHPQLSEQRLSVTDLLSQPFLLTEKGMSYRRILDEALASRSMEIVPVLETGNAAQICQLVAENLGISFLPEYTVRHELQKGRIQCLSVTDFTADVWKQLLYHRDKWLSPAMQVVIDYCKGL